MYKTLNKEINIFCKFFSFGFTDFLKSINFVPKSVFWDIFCYLKQGLNPNS